MTDRELPLIVHTHPPLCFPTSLTTDTSVRVARVIDEVTCPVCVYYWWHPEARELELSFRRRT